MTEELHNLSEWLRRQNDIPEKRVHKETLLDIAGIDHLENQWSNIYAYFLNPNASHGFMRLFIDSLLNIISARTSQSPLEMKSFSVVREEPVKKKRIDLLIVNDDEAIIIENKVYHSLDNQLDLYWKRPNVPEQNKRGIVLTLWSISVSDTNYINVTHEDYAHEIERNLPKYFTNANTKALLLLQDFIQNIYNVTHAMNEEELYFYFQNRGKINRLAEIRKSVITYIWETIEDSGKSKLLQRAFHDNGWSLSIQTKIKENYCYYVFNELRENVKLTLYYETVWNYKNNGCRIGLFLELCGAQMIKFVEKKRDDLKEMGLEPDQLKKEKTWWHYKGTEIRFDNPKDLSNEQEIVNRIVNAIKDSHFYEDGKKIIGLWNKYHNN